MRLNHEIVTNALDAMAFLLVTVDLYGRENIERLNAQIKEIKPDFNPLEYWRTPVRFWLRKSRTMARWRATAFYSFVAIGAACVIYGAALGAQHLGIWRRADNAITESYAKDQHAISGLFKFDAGLERQGKGKNSKEYRDYIAKLDTNFEREKEHRRALLRQSERAAKSLFYTRSFFAMLLVFPATLLVMQVLQFIRFGIWFCARSATAGALFLTRLYRLEGVLVLTGTAVFIFSRIYAIAAIALGQ